MCFLLNEVTLIGDFHFMYFADRLHKKIEMIRELQKSHSALSCKSVFASKTATSFRWHPKVL